MAMPARATFHPVIYTFAGCELDTSRHVLRRAGEEQKLEPQAFDVLVYLTENRGRLVQKEELLDEIWGDRFVSESALTSRIKSARRAVGDDGKTQGVIRTVHGRGYEFVAEVTPRDAVAGSGAEADSAGSPLPAPVHQLVGRDDLLLRLEAELDDSRLLTLVGPAGVGKTTVALALARLVSDRYSDGVWPVELATVTAPDAAVQVLATALDTKSQHEQSLADSVVELLGPREALLVLDNCEHVIEPMSEIAEEILRVAPAVTVIATSREPLATPSEQLWPIDPLPVVVDEDADAARLAANPSVRLFVERAQAADPHFELTDANAPAVAEICRRLDGIPLAIELAAARQRTLDVSDLADRLNERFRLLKAVRRGTDERHQTLQNAVRWSYDLLSDDEQRVFDSLSVFAGSFSLDAAEAVLADDGDDEIDVLDTLGRLVDRSMLTMRRPEPGGTRHEMLDTMREFGRTRLGDDETVELHRRHRDHFHELAEQIGASRLSPDEGRSIDMANRSFPDLRAAHRFAVETGDVDTAMEMIDLLCEYAMRSLRYEVLDWVPSVLKLPGADEHPLHAQLFAVQGYGAWVRGEYDLAVSLAEAGLAEQEARDLPRSTTPHRVLGNVAYLTGDVDLGLTHTRQMLDIAEESGDPSKITHAAYMHSIAASSQDRSDYALELLELADRASKETMNPTDLASASVARAFAIQDDDLAIASCGVAAELAGDSGNRWMQAFARTELSGRLLVRGDLAAACGGLGQVVEVWHRSGDWAQVWLALTHSAVALCDLGSDELAALVIGSTDHHATYATTPLSPPSLREAVRAAEALTTRLGDNHYRSLLAEGAVMPVSELVHRTRAAMIAGGDR